MGSSAEPAAPIEPPEEEAARGCCDRNNEGCGRAMGIFLFAAVLLGLGFSIATFSSCAFLSLSKKGSTSSPAPSFVPSSVPSVAPSILPSNNTSTNETAAPDSPATNETAPAVSPAANETASNQTDSEGDGNLTTATVSDGDSQRRRRTLQEIKSLNDVLDRYSYATIGMNQWEPQNEGCRQYADEGMSLSTGLKTAYVGSIIGLSAGLLATVLLFVEMVLCRFTCSRTLAALALLIALLGQLLTFVIYASDFCRYSPPGTNFEVYSCGALTATWWSVIAIVCYSLALILSCPAPKTKPFVRVILERDVQQENDPCCYCFKKKEEIEKVDEEEEREGSVTGQEQISELQTSVQSAPVAAPPPIQNSDLYYASAIPPPSPAPSTIETYPMETYTARPPTTPRNELYANAEVTEGDLFFDAMTV